MLDMQLELISDQLALVICRVCSYVVLLWKPDVKLGPNPNDA